MHLRMPAFHSVYFDDQLHTADDRGILRNVPHDAATRLIKNQQGHIREAKAEDLAPPAQPAKEEPVEKPVKAKAAPASQPAE